MINQGAFQSILKDRFASQQARNSRYSMRAFADSLGMAAGPLSQILNGKRKVSEKLAVKVLDTLKVGPRARGALYLVEAKSETPAISPISIDEDQFRVISDWFHYGILSLALVKGFQSKASWVGKRLGISENQAADAISRLLRLNLLMRSPDGRLKPTHQAIHTSDELVSASLKKAHLQTLELAKKSLEKDSIGIRDFITLTVPTSPEKIREAKAFMRKSQQELGKILMNTTEKSEVYRISFELFPLTQIKSSS